MLVVRMMGFTLPECCKFVGFSNKEVVRIKMDFALYFDCAMDILLKNIIRPSLNGKMFQDIGSQIIETNWISTFLKRLYHQSHLLTYLMLLHWQIYSGNLACVVSESEHRFFTTLIVRTETNLNRNENQFLFLQSDLKQNFSSLFTGMNSQFLKIFQLFLYGSVV